MRIGIDARLIEETGVGRYIQNLIRELEILDYDNDYVLFLRKQKSISNKRWKTVIADIPWHSLREQLEMPSIFKKQALDVLHVPYYNIPLFYKGKLIVTIHDLIPFHVSTGQASKMPYPFYVIKRFLFWIVLFLGLRKANKIIAVSQATKDDIVKLFGIDNEKIIVTYEGIDDDLITKNPKNLIKEKYVLYVGNAYPHKNVEMLLEAWKSIHIKLVLVGDDDYFYPRLKQKVKDVGIEQSVQFFGTANNEELRNLYAHAEALVTPSLIEGFGLPGLEALANKLPVAAADIPVYREIYGDAVFYFDPKNASSIAEAIHKIISDKEVRSTLIKQGLAQSKKYSWATMTEQTLALYTHQ